jgi:hypothetical protein
MYSRYTGYRPFDPMNNRLSQNYGPVPQPAHAQPGPPAPEPSFPQPAAAAAAAPLAQKGLLESLFGGGGGQSRSKRGGGQQGLLGSLGNFDLGGIADLLRSGGGGIGKFLSGLSVNWDAGDILLVLILLFLSLESDDDEILILLALVLVMGL